LFLLIVLYLSKARFLIPCYATVQQYYGRAGTTELVLPNVLLFDSLNFSEEGRDDLARIRLSSGNRNVVGAALP
jgi:hypothetical protein